MTDSISKIEEDEAKEKAQQQYEKDISEGIAIATQHSINLTAFKLSLGGGFKRPQDEDDWTANFEDYLTSIQKFGFETPKVWASAFYDFEVWNDLSPAEEMAVTLMQTLADLEDNQELQKDAIVETLLAFSKSESGERFTKPTDEEIIEAAILFNEGKLEIDELTSIVGCCEYLIERLYDNGTVKERSQREIAMEKERLYGLKDAKPN